MQTGRVRPYVYPIPRHRSGGFSRCMNSAGRSTPPRRREPRMDDPSVTKREAEVLRTSFHDFLSERGQGVHRYRKPTFESNSAQERHTDQDGAADRDWRPNFLRAYLRAGDVAAAARMIRVPEETVQKAIAAEPELQAKCSTTLGNYLWRNIRPPGWEAGIQADTHR